MIKYDKHLFFPGFPPNIPFTRTSDTELWWYNPINKTKVFGKGSAKEYGQVAQEE